MSDAILGKVTEVFRDVLDEDDLVLTRETTASDVENWDSLSHVRLIVACEQEFKIRFTASEIASLPNVGALVDLIQKKAG